MRYQCGHLKYLELRLCEEARKRTKSLVCLETTSELFEAKYTEQCKDCHRTSQLQRMIGINLYVPIPTVSSHLWHTERRAHTRSHRVLRAHTAHTSVILQHLLSNQLLHQHAVYSLSNTTATSGSVFPICRHVHYSHLHSDTIPTRSRVNRNTSNTRSRRQHTSQTCSARSKSTLRSSDHISLKIH